jgi:hypothetical protein
VTRERVLKGYQLRILYSDGKVEVQTFDTDELGTLDDILTRFMIISLEDIEYYTVRKVWE